MEQIEAQDEAIHKILMDGNPTIVSYLDSVFGFLYRRTDFFKAKNKVDDPVGFMPGEAMNLVLKIFKQYQDLEEYSQRLAKMERLKGDGIAPAAAAEVEVISNDDLPVGPLEKASASAQGPDESESHNGAACDGYSWSQTIADVDISVKVPKHVVKGKQIKVETTNRLVKVVAGDDCLLDGELTNRVKCEETIWSLVPGKCVQLHFEKCEERWWDGLLTTDGKIDVRQIDSTRSLYDYSESDEMRIREMVLHQERKTANHEPKAVEEMLKTAWDADGSPFKGTPYDPSKVNFQA
ncbi:Hypothetical predicted protein [Cloeon dipterum]|uniref:CS domain-containing protein n=1 Tax=Cloeon dipterum TaxID=197152 RepID=A0A8S1CRL2_9INSE|nr:Hypothetical predicted protein [Cloeon dipterum]